MVAVAVGGLHKQIVRFRRNIGLGHKQGFGPAQVAGKDETHGLVLSFLFHFHFQEGRAEYMPGVPELDLDPRRGLKLFIIFDAAQILQGFQSVFLGIQRLHGFLAAAAEFCVFKGSFHFLNMGAVLQHHFQQVYRGHSAIYVSLETVFNHIGKKPGMIYVGMGNQEKINFFGAVYVNILVTHLYRGAALMHAAVHGKTLAINFNHMAGTGNGLGCP